MRWAPRCAERAPYYGQRKVVLEDYNTAAVLFVIKGRSRWSYFQMMDVLPLPRLRPCSHVPCLRFGSCVFLFAINQDTTRDMCTCGPTTTAHSTHLLSVVAVAHPSQAAARRVSCSNVTHINQSAMADGRVYNQPVQFPSIQFLLRTILQNHAIVGSTSSS
jgi:hypothetical protein